MPTFAVSYGYLAGSDDARTAHRPAHLAFLTGLHSAGLLYMSGPLASTPGTALLIFEDVDAETLAGRLDEDPFFIEGLISERTITAWNVFFDPRTPASA